MKIRILSTVLLVPCFVLFGYALACPLTEQMGADWIVVQYNREGAPFCCWKLRGVSVSNKPNSDGIYWKDTLTGNLIHVSGWYNWVQVNNNHWEEAAESLGVNVDWITNGRYVTPAKR